MITNISNRFRISKAPALFFLLAAAGTAVAQPAADTRPPVTSSYTDYRHQVSDDPDKKMVELKSRIPGVVYDLRYATKNNFMNRAMYPPKTRKTFLRVKAATALQAVQEELKEKGLGLKIFDAYRPYAVTVKFWELVKDERYVANPAKGSGHNRGTTVDLTIIQLASREELNMGTGFDNFSDTAHHDFSNLPEDVLQNRILLKTVMEKYGFKAYKDEWWHYSFADSKPYELLDIPFKKLQKRL
ncbi:MAG TPA: M15 family metallopeptidase [Chitinophagaceae bacterium]|nr:M15 family metallopeptidase [Chitinophagaceae bacterium]